MQDVNSKEDSHNHLRQMKADKRISQINTLRPRPLSVGISAKTEIQRNVITYVNYDINILPQLW